MDLFLIFFFINCLTIYLKSTVTMDYVVDQLAYLLASILCYCCLNVPFNIELDAAKTDPSHMKTGQFKFHSIVFHISYLIVVIVAWEQCKLLHDIHGEVDHIGTKVAVIRYMVWLRLFELISIYFTLRFIFNLIVLIYFLIKYSD